MQGAKPVDLPMQGPDRFELAINLKTAKALGLVMPPSLLARGDIGVADRQLCAKSRRHTSQRPRGSLPVGQRCDITSSTRATNAKFDADDERKSTSVFGLGGPVVSGVNPIAEHVRRSGSIALTGRKKSVGNWRRPTFRRTAADWHSGHWLVPSS